MPFTLESDNLPVYVKKQPLAIAKRWIEIFNKYFESDDSSMAWDMANHWLRRVIDFQKNNPTTEEPKDDMELVDIAFKTENEELVIRADGDEEYIDFILADTLYDDYGTSYEEEFLRELADYINKHGIDGDFNHEMLYKLKDDGYSIEAIKAQMRSKPSIAKAVKATVDQGKLFIRTTFDKRYRKRIEQSKGVSIEGAFKRNKVTRRFDGGAVFGFSFIDRHDKEPGNPRARRV
jgi:hypothetical protein